MMGRASELRILSVILGLGGLFADPRPPQIPTMKSGRRNDRAFMNRVEKRRAKKKAAKRR